MQKAHVSFLGRCPRLHWQLHLLALRRRACVHLHYRLTIQCLLDLRELDVGALLLRRTHKLMHARRNISDLLRIGVKRFCSFRLGHLRLQLEL